VSRRRNLTDIAAIDSSLEVDQKHYWELQIYLHDHGAKVKTVANTLYHAPEDKHGDVDRGGFEGGADGRDEGTDGDGTVAAETVGETTGKEGRNSGGNENRSDRGWWVKGCRRSV
jgi:hypothetical protein